MTYKQAMGVQFPGSLRLLQQGGDSSPSHEPWPPWRKGKPRPRSNKTVQLWNLIQIPCAFTPASQPFASNIGQPIKSPCTGLLNPRDLKVTHQRSRTARSVDHMINRKALVECVAARGWTPAKNTLKLFLVIISAKKRGRGRLTAILLPFVVWSSMTARLLPNEFAYHIAISC